MQMCRILWNLTEIREWQTTHTRIKKKKSPAKALHLKRPKKGEKTFTLGQRIKLIYTPPPTPPTHTMKKCLI